VVDALAIGSVALVDASAAPLAVLVLRRFALARAERRRAGAEERLRPFAPDDALAFAGLLARYARRLRGGSAERIAGYFERHGFVAREVAALADRRSWRRATAAYALGDMFASSAVPQAQLRIERLEELVRLDSADAPQRGDERRFTLLYLRGYAGLDGRLPHSFDGLVDDVFGDLLQPVGEAA
jgi:hypothetical protein